MKIYKVILDGIYSREEWFFKTKDLAIRFIKTEGKSAFTNINNRYNNDFIINKVYVNTNLKNIKNN